MARLARLATLAGVRAPRVTARKLGLRTSRAGSVGDGTCGSHRGGALLLHAALSGQVNSPAGLVQEIAGWGLGWLIGVFVGQTAAYAMGGKSLPAATFRALAFSQTTSIVLLLGLIPTVGPTARALALVLGFVSSWMAFRESLQLRGWHLILVPFISAVVLLISTLIVVLWVTGTGVTLLGLLLRLGLNLR